VTGKKKRKGNGKKGIGIGKRGESGRRCGSKEDWEREEEKKKKKGQRDKPEIEVLIAGDDPQGDHTENEINQ